MRNQLRNKTSLRSRVSTLAILAAAGSLGATHEAQAACGEGQLVITTPTTVTGVHECAVATDVVGDVTNNGTIGPPGDGDYGFFVGKGGITGALINNGIIEGGGEGSDVWGALTIGTDVSDGILNNGIISSATGNGIQLGYGTSDGGWFSDVTGTMTNSGAITATLGDGVAAILGSTSGGLINENDGTISGGNRGVYVAEDFDSWSGGIINAGQIEGNVAGIQIGDISPDGGGEGVTFSGGMTNDVGGTITSLTGPTVAVGGSSFDGGIDNFGLITQRDEDEASGESPYAGVGILVTADTFAGGIANSGQIDGLGGPAIWITGGTSSFDGGIQNSGQVNGAEDAVRVESGTFVGNFTNDGTIIGDTYAGVYIASETFEGDVWNTGYIEGGFTGMYVFATDTFEGDITNDGTIVGNGIPVEGLAAIFDPGLIVQAANYNGNIINNGTLSGFSNGLFVDVLNLSGSITNTGLIEATGGGTAVSLEVGNGTTFLNTGDGTILGDVIFGGKAPYDFIAEDGGVEGSLFGQPNGASLNDDVVTVQDGSHYFVFQGKSGSANNFAAFNVEDGGVAVVGARSIGDTAGTGYVFNNVDALNVNAGGDLYLDKQAQLNVGTYSQNADAGIAFFLTAPAGGEGSSAVATPGVHYGQILASGVVDLDGGLYAVLDPLSFAGTDLTEIEYNDVVVGGSLTGDFASDEILGDSYFFSLSHLIDGSTVDLRLSRTGFNDIPCLNGNNDSFGNALETIFSSGGPINGDLFQYLAGLSESEVCSAFDDLGGTVLADLGAVVVETAGPWKNMVNDRTNGLASGSCGLAGDGWCLNRFAANEVGAGQVMTDATPGDDPFAWLRTGVRRVGETAAWGRLIGVWGDTSGSGGVAGTDFHVTGGIVGVDHVFTPVLLAGVAAQWTNSEVDFDGRSDNANVDSVEFGAYVSYGDTRFYINANASFIWHDFQVQRSVLGLAAIGEYDGTTISAYAETGKIFETGGWRLQPLVAVSYAHLETDDYREFGNAIDLLNVQGSEFDTLKSLVGLRLAYPFVLESGRKLVPEARVVWAHEFMDDHSSFVAALQSAPNVLFTVTGQDYALDSIIIGTGISAPISDNGSLYWDYDAGINRDITTHTLSAGFRVRW